MKPATIDNLIETEIVAPRMNPRTLYVFYELFCKSLPTSEKKKAEQEDLIYLMSEGWDKFVNTFRLRYKGFDIRTDTMNVIVSVPRLTSHEFRRKAEEYVRLTNLPDESDPLLTLGSVQ